MWNLLKLNKIQNNKKQDDKLPPLIIGILIIIVYGIKSIINSWWLIYCIFFLIIWAIFYFTFSCFGDSIFRYIGKRSASKPVSLWRVYSKKYPIIIQYTPPKGINPAEAGLLYNCKVDVTDLTSLIYQWTFEWLIEIKNVVWQNSNKIEKIELTKLNNMPDNHPFFEKDIFDFIFLNNDKKIITYAFQLKYALLLEDLEIHWMQKWWLYRPTPTKIWKIIYSILVILLAISFLLLFRINAHEIYAIESFLVLLFICIILWWYIFWWKSLKLTDEWARLASQVIGYRNFIKSCDAKKIELFLKQDPLFVDKTLPYATAFWIETDFIKKITPMKSDFYGKYPYWNRKSNLSSVISYFLKD